MNAYRELESRFRRIAVIGGAAAMLGWDSAAMMPPGGAEARAEQRATLALLRHEMLCDPRLAALLDEAEAAAAALAPWPAANLREMRRRWRHAAALPADLVEATVKANAASEMFWRTARHANDFEGQLPLLAPVLSLARETAAAKAAAFGLEPYDALLEGYEAGLRQAGIEPVFAALEAALPGLLEAALERQAAAPPPLPLPARFPRERQRALGLELMRGLGFDFRHGRLDESHHPFTGGVPEDVRITTRYDEADYGASAMAVLHETGHALYAQNLPAEWRYQPVGEAMGMVVHESQSLIVEMQACRSDAYLGHLGPLLRQAFGGDAAAWAPANLAAHVRRISRDLIRVDANELTYPLHVILRYRLEQALLSGALPAADLPGAWAEGMRALIGAVPPDHASGCMQDTHWFSGSFGYFPTYTLGAVAAAQLYRAAAAAIDLSTALARGEFRPLLDWLGEKVHRQGRLHASHDALLEHATGRPLGAAAFLEHLRQRYG